MHSRLRRFRLLLTMHVWNETHEWGQIVVANTELELPHEQCRFNISNCTAELQGVKGGRMYFWVTYFNDADTWLFTRLVHRDFGNSLNPILNFVRCMWDSLPARKEKSGLAHDIRSRTLACLHCFPQIFSLSLHASKLWENHQNRLTGRFLTYECKFRFTNLSVNLSCGDIVIPARSDIQIAFIVPQIKIDFTTVLQHVSLQNLSISVHSLIAMRH